MLQVTVTNKRQRRSFTHPTGPLRFGRGSEGEGDYFSIDDVYVSRDQLLIEERPGGELNVENRGRNSILMIDQTEITKGQSRVEKLPTRLTVGETAIDIALAKEELDTEATFFMAESDSFPSMSVSALSHVFQTYPYPLAYGNRLLSGVTVPTEHYAEQLRLAENVIAFIASVAVALLDDDEIPQLNQSLGQSALHCWQGGISPGHWLDLGIHATTLLQQHDDPLAHGLAGLQLNKGKKGFGRAIRDLITAKNDFKHDRGPNIDLEYREGCRHVGALLRTAFERLSFLASHPIRLVQEVNPQRRGDKSDVVYLNCMGEHAGFMRESAVEFQSLRKGDLYIEVEPMRKVSLYPFIHATTCRQCKTREFFFIDRLESSRSGGASVAELKSFERGHTESDEDIGRELDELFADAS